ncbi:hypothetical protein AUEXF2481DRAFT_37757 [Aureobasidium subglaciale EXF-2481]|uniref:Uncharacterized protein n=1 Tax=Aureobasidium subglaciale (strain EXF-2481) TaxID=1043005 RepID=A0A074ZF25_AURSE|nr:uncharacterized protein AUEXF2481DRAFT_37757 [Aureobasidium subglaciale EXF-2481]KEQ97226.1 hypothetical protein AUEXF2481DRAFT_37757 [Aureobasidium subglaciale EXF-2481]
MWSCIDVAHSSMIRQIGLYTKAHTEQPDSDQVTDSMETWFKRDGAVNSNNFIKGQDKSRNENGLS